MLDLNRMRILVALDAHGSVTAAARELGYSQSSLSYHLTRLESEAGTDLTRRVGRGLQLTPAGELLVRRATEILGRMESAEAELAAIGDLRSGRVRVAGFQSILATAVAGAAAGLRARAPGIEVGMIDIHREPALRRLREGDVDVAVFFAYEEDEVPGDVRATHLFDEPVYLLSKKAGETLADHRDSPWIAGCEHCRRDLVGICHGGGFEPRIMYTSDDALVKQSLVASGLGVATLPRLSLAYHRTPGFEATELRGVCRRVYLATYGEPPDPPATEAFVQAVLRRCSELGPGPTASE